jgi:hypothetical protein
MKVDKLKYIATPINELKKIKPHWAIEENISHLLDIALHPKFGRFVFLSINTKDLIINADFKEVDNNTLFTGEHKNDIRISQILNFWENGKFIDPPSIGYSNENKKIEFYDGRHRTKLSYFLKLKEIPVAIEKEDLEKIKLLLTAN